MAPLFSGGQVTIRTIRGRIIVAIFLVGCIPLLIGLALASMSGMRSLRDVIGANFETIAIQAADRVVMRVQGEIQSLNLLASAPLRVRQPVFLANQSYAGDAAQVADILRARVRAWEREAGASKRVLGSELSRFLLETKVRAGSKMAGLLITDRHGALVAASSEPDRYAFGGEPWWQALQSNQSERVYIGDLVGSGQDTFRSPEETIDIAVAVMDDRQHEMIGAVKATYRFDDLFAMIQQIRIGQTGHVMLFNAAGVPLVCPILPRQAHRIQPQLMELIVSKEPGWGIAGDDGHGAHDTVVGFAPIRGLGGPASTWHMFVRQHPSESYAPIYAQRNNLALIGVVMLGLLAVIGRYVAARMAQPVQVLREGVESISRGTYDGPLAIKTGDEFEDLAQAVHRMADRLKASHAELEALNRDLTQRVEEKTLEVTRQMRKLELSERLATLGKVASGIAHEINNPLGIILNRLECMEAEAAHLPLPEEYVRDLSSIKAQAERIIRVTRSMLALTRGAATTYKPIDLNCVVRTCLDAAQERVSAHRVRMEADLAPVLPPVIGDRDRLETVVLNVLNNAIDAVQACGEAGVVTVRTRHVRTGEGDWTEIVIADNGPGIPEDDKDRIFDPFFTTKAVGQGTGLGLFLSYGIVAEHRGILEVKNSDRGAVFSIRLPALSAVSETQQESIWGSREKF